jgi:hypothetical protein
MGRLVHAVPVDGNMIRSRRPKSKSYKYKIQGIPAEPITPVAAVETKDEEVLSGQVNGKSASDVEERSAKSMARMPTVKGYQFRYVFFGPRNSSGSVEVDYLVLMVNGRVYTVLVDGEFAHKDAAQKSRDKLNDQKLWNKLKGQISAPPIRIPGDELSSQDASDAKYRELLL